MQKTDITEKSKMSEGSGTRYDELASNGSSWIDRLTDKRTFEDWKLHKHQIRTKMNFAGFKPSALHKTEDNSIRGLHLAESVQFPQTLWRKSSFANSDGGKHRRVRKRALYTLLTVIGLIVIIIPIVLVVLLRTANDNGPETEMGTVYMEVTVQNMEYSEALNDTESEEYRNFTNQFCEQMGMFYQSSSLDEVYTGCLVKELRPGSIKVIFTLVFSSKKLPTSSAVRKVFTDSGTSTVSGPLLISVGFYLITDSSVVVGDVTMIEQEDNPTPRLRFGESCTVNEACKTYHAVCTDGKCGCSSSRYYSLQSDTCIKLSTTSSVPTTTVPLSSSKGITVSTSASDAANKTQTTFKIHSSTDRSTPVQTRSLTETTTVPTTSPVPTTSVTVSSSVGSRVSTSVSAASNKTQTTFKIPSTTDRSSPGQTTSQTVTTTVPTTSPVPTTSVTVSSSVGSRVSTSVSAASNKTQTTFKIPSTTDRSSPGQTTSQTVTTTGRTTSPVPSTTVSISSAVGSTVSTSVSDTSNKTQTTLIIPSTTDRSSPGQTTSQTVSTTAPTTSPVPTTTVPISSSVGSTVSTSVSDASNKTKTTFIIHSTTDRSSPVQTTSQTVTTTGINSPASNSGTGLQTFATNQTLTTSASYKTSRPNLSSTEPTRNHSSTYTTESSLITDTFSTTEQSSSTETSSTISTSKFSSNVTATETLFSKPATKSTAATGSSSSTESSSTKDIFSTDDSSNSRTSQTISKPHFTTDGSAVYESSTMTKSDVSLTSSTKKPSSFTVDLTTFHKEPSTTSEHSSRSKPSPSNFTTASTKDYSATTDNSSTTYTTSPSSFKPTTGFFSTSKTSSTLQSLSMASTPDFPSSTPNDTTVPSKNTTFISSTTMKSNITSEMPVSLEATSTALSSLRPTSQAPSATTSSSLTTANVSGTSKRSSPPSSTETLPSSTSESTTSKSPVLKIIPSVSILSDQKLEIGSRDEIICKIDNATDWIIITLTKTSSDSSDPEFIGDVILKNGTWEPNYGNNTNHITILVNSFDIQVSLNVTVIFVPVLCNDGGQYKFSVTVPAYLHDPIETLQDIEAYKTPIVKLIFPYELREGLWGLNIGCSASLRSSGNLTLMRKWPGEDEFSPFVPVVNHPRELRYNETINSTLPCIKDVVYDFDTSLGGWNLTEIRCAIDEGTVNEAFSGIGVFRIVPRSICNGIEAGQNVHHPFHCNLYITCNDDETFWGFVQQSDCPTDQCWLSEGLCGTTTTLTTPTTSTLPPYLPYVLCALKAVAKEGESATITCNLRNVEMVTRVQVNSSRLYFEEVNEDGLSGNYSGEVVQLVIDMEAENEIVITLENVTCSLEGDIVVHVNGNISDTVLIMIIGDAEPPKLSTPDKIYRNQLINFTCTGNVGRTENGSPKADLGFEIEFRDMNVNYTSGIVLHNDSSKCKNLLTVQLILPAFDWLNGSYIRCVATELTSSNITLASADAGLIELLAANIFFDKDLQTTAVIGETFSFTCSFQNLQDVEYLAITRGEPSEKVLIFYKNGTVDQTLDRFILNSSEWDSDFGSVTIDVVIQCEDKTLYRCNADGHSGSAAMYISVLRRPEKPTLTLSRDMVVDQEPWADRLSECKAQLGDPAGNLVVEVLREGVFQVYDIEYGNGYPVNTSLECGTEQTIQFYFADLSDLNNTMVQCAVKPAAVFNDTEKLTSDPQTLRTVDSSYCDGINMSFYVHPYDCHYYVDCNFYNNDNVHFTRCLPPDECPNPLGGCDLDSCATVCNRGLQCDGEKEATLLDNVTLVCALSNTETLQTVTIYHDSIVIFNKTGSSGNVSSDDGSITLMYTNEMITVDIHKIKCSDGGKYTVIANGLLSDTTTVVVRTPAEVPKISATRFVVGQLATVTCHGVIGNPAESRMLYVEVRPSINNSFEPINATFLPAVFNSSSCAYEMTTTFTIKVFDWISNSTFRCRTSTGMENILSSNISVNTEQQEVDIYPPHSNVTVGQPVSISCTVTGVSELASIRFYRKSDPTQTLCEVTQERNISKTTDVNCTGYVTPVSGNLTVDFPSFQCGTDGDYVCECNPEASTPKLTHVSFSKPPQNPKFTSVPKTLVENTTMLNEESFTCEADLGYPSSGKTLVFQTNKSGEYMPYQFSGIDRNILGEECEGLETATVKLFSFDISWNNTKIRCVLEDPDGSMTNYTSEDFIVQLLPDTVCDGEEEYRFHPFDKNQYIRCAATGLSVNTCNLDCPVITNGTLITCRTCDIT